MKSDDVQLDEVIEAVRQSPIPPYPRERVQFVLPPSKIRPNVDISLWGRQISRYRIPAATAATIVFVCLAAFWNWGPLGAQKSFALQQVAEAFARVKTVQFKRTVTGWKGKPWPDPHIQTLYFDGDVRTRQESDLSLHVLDWKLARFITVNYEHKKATIRPIYGEADGQWASGHSVTDFLEVVRTAAATAAVRTEKTTDDGQEVVEFRWTHRERDYLVTVDTDTKLPVRIEWSHVAGNGTKLRTVQSGFVYEQPMDDTLFEVEIPEGFTIEEWTPDLNNTSYPEKDAEQLVVAPGRFGPVKAGMTEAEAIQLLGTPDRISRSRAANKSDNFFLRLLGGGEIVELDYSSRGFILKLYPSGELNFSCVSQASTGPWVRDFAGRTAEGVRIGDSRQKVFDAYGKPDGQAPNSVAYLELGWRFSFRNDRVIGFAISKPQPLNELEGIQRRVLKNGNMIEAGPGVDIDALIDEDGNRKKDKRGPIKEKSEADSPQSGNESRPPAPNP